MTKYNPPLLGLVRSGDARDEVRKLKEELERMSNRLEGGR